MEQVLTDFSETTQSVLRIRYGLDDGITRSYEEARKKLRSSFKLDLVFSTEMKAKRQLRHPSKSILRGYRSTAENSLGRRIFNAVFIKDLPIDNSPLEPEPQEELINNLLPEIPLTPAQLTALREVKLEELKLSSRPYNRLVFEGVKTVADILKLSREELSRIRAFGIVSAHDLGLALQQVLESEFPEENYSEGYVAKLLQSAFEKQPKLSPVEKRLERDKAELQRIRSLVHLAIEQGLGSSEEIQDWIKKDQGDEALFGIRSDSWKMTALIEYILNHPEE